ncbi:MAG: hypothetical protein KKC18_14320 [Chloroflexi bacterium]|nr:hypothetical protein [Chloroflexota bacterium]
MQQLIDQLSATYVEWSETIEPLVAAVIARRHAVLIGLPGTAKSLLIRDLAAGLGGPHIPWSRHARRWSAWLC